MKKLLLYFIFILIFNSCHQKTLKLDIEESKCKRFKISELTLESYVDPSCSGADNYYEFALQFKFDGDESCIKYIQIEPIIFDSTNAKLNVPFEKNIEKNASNVTITGNTIKVIYRINLTESVPPQKVNHIIFSVNTETELMNQSNILKYRYNTYCSKLPDGTYKVVKTINSDYNFVDIVFFDDATEDGDIISVNLNDAWVIENLTLTNEGKYYTFNLNKGTNTLAIFALNQGRVGPNTCGVGINYTDTIKITSGLETGEAINIQF